MVLNTQAKQEIINKHQAHGTDTGSAEVQIAMLSERINQLTNHLKTNSHDFSSRQGLLKMIGQRKRLLNYLRSKSKSKYEVLVRKLNLRG